METTMYSADGPTPRRLEEEEVLTAFGGPVFVLVDQPQLEPAGWEYIARDSTIRMVGAGYWLADRDGVFDTPGRLTKPGAVLLRGLVHTEVPGSSQGSAPGSDVDEALTEHLSDAVVNWRINQPDFSIAFRSPEWIATTDLWRREIASSTSAPAELVVDGRVIPAQRTRSDEFTATAAGIQGRVVTLVLHNDDYHLIDPRMKTRITAS